MEPFLKRRSSERSDYARISISDALNDPVRIKILEILSHKQMTTEEIAKILRRSGHKKATTTIRHHLDILKSAGLIEVSKMVEARGMPESITCRPCVHSLIKSQTLKSIPN